MGGKIVTILFVLCLLFSPVALAEYSLQQCDVSYDGTIDEYDLGLLCENWLCNCNTVSCGKADIDDNNTVDFKDFAGLADFWMESDPSAYLVGWWKFDEGDAFWTYDSSGNGHTGVMHNMTPSDWVSGKRNLALEFDGYNDYVMLYEEDNGLGQYFTRDFTISAWVNQYSSPGRQTIIGIESTSEFTTYGFEGFTLELLDGVLRLFIAYEEAEQGEYPDMTRDIVFANTAVSPNQWHHICVVRSGPNVWFYLDGQLDAVIQVSPENINFGSDWPGYDSIGATSDSYYHRKEFFHGRIDDVRIYNQALSEQVLFLLSQDSIAWAPTPPDSATNMSIDLKLRWEKGFLAAELNCHDVYLGTDYSEVENATTSDLDVYHGRQTATIYDPCGLEVSTDYYWRIDTIDVNEIVHQGNIWTFSTADTNVGFYIDASCSKVGFEPHGAYDGYRFETTSGNCWKGDDSQGSWYWQINFSTAQPIGSILMIMGENESVQQNTPLDYMWRYSNDGIIWYDLTETHQQNERRLFRIHRLGEVVNVKHLRLEIYDTIGDYPTIREVELYNNTDSQIAFEDWLVAVDITESSYLPSYAQAFINLAWSCPGWYGVQAQEIWLGDFDESYLDIEPYPLCVFLSGSILEWCQRTREPFAGLQQVLINGNIPIWGSCGGAQILGILLDTGYENPWDCPRCRDPYNPFCPIYGHIGYLDPNDPGECGDYTKAIMETGPHNILKVTDDPALAGLDNEFLANESHMGQLEYLPVGWHLVATAGEGTLTVHQCFRQDDRYIYGAQFHIENYDPATWQNSIQIMSNFLNLAQQWGGYQQSP